MLFLFLSFNFNRLLQILEISRCVNANLHILLRFCLFLDLNRDLERLLLNGFSLFLSNLFKLFLIVNFNCWLVNLCCRFLLDLLSGLCGCLSWLNVLNLLLLAFLHLLGLFGLFNSRFSLFGCWGWSKV